MYDVVDDYVRRPAPYRAEHIARALAAAAKGDADGVVVLFRGDSPAAVEAFAREDPCVKHGLVTAWRVREWTTAVGTDAAVQLPAVL